VRLCAQLFVVEPLFLGKRGDIILLFIQAVCEG
jgi:hypothetical protein